MEGTYKIEGAEDSVGDGERSCGYGGPGGVASGDGVVDIEILFAFSDDVRLMPMTAPRAPPMSRHRHIHTNAFTRLFLALTMFCSSCSQKMHRFDLARIVLGFPILH
jgi:hypothetical protein